MKECPKCHRRVGDTIKFCPECGSQLSTAKSDTAIASTAPKAIKKHGGASQSLTAPSQDEDALAFVYIAQYVRRDGAEEAGVLVDDCKPYFQEIHRLMDMGSVQDKNWYKLRGYATTAEGSRHAALIIQRRIDQNKNILSKLLDSLPPRFLQFFRGEVMNADVHTGARNVNTIGATFIDQEPDAHLCLLSDRQVKKLLDNVINVLIQQGVVVTAHTYASSHQGRIDNLVYCFAPEFAVFFDKYLISAGKFAVSPLFDKNLEEKHRIYHQLNCGITSGKNYLDKADLDELRMIRGSLRADLKRTFDNLGRLKAISEDPSRVFVENPTVFQDVVHQEFLSPLVDHLLSHFPDNNMKIAGPSVSVDNSPNETKLIGAPQVDLLFGEMKDDEVHD